MAFTAHLKIGHKEYLLLECWYEFVKPTIGNRVCGRVPDETYIHFTIAANSDDPFLYEWMSNPMLRYDGSILFLRDTDAFPFKTLYFENAFCINLHDSFNKQSNVQMITTVTILAAKVTFDEKEKDDVPLARGTSEVLTYNTEPDKSILTKDIPSKADDIEEETKEEDIGNNKVGLLGESAIATKLKAEGYEVLQIQNNSGHGIDIIAKDADGNVKCIEVKANSSSLSKAQQKGGEDFVDDRLKRSIGGKSHYKIPPNSKQMKKDAQTAKKWIQDADKVEYEIHRVDVDRITGKVSNQRVSEWNVKK